MFNLHFKKNMFNLKKNLHQHVDNMVGVLQILTGMGKCGRQLCIIIN